MSNPIVKNLVTDPTGAPIANAPVTVVLVGGPGFVGSTQEIINQTTVTTDNTGLWTAQLVPNASITTPAGTYYKVIEPGGASWTFIVPAGAGPYWLNTILTVNPASPAASLGATRYDVDQTGTLTLAQQAVAAANTGLLPTFDNLFPIYAYGNSYAVLSALTYTAGLHYLQQAQTRLHAGALTSYGVAGTRIVDVLGGMINGSAIPGCTAPVAGALWPGTTGQRQGLVVLEALYNDIGHYPNSQVATSIPTVIAANGFYRNGFKNMLRLALALASSDSRVEDSAASYGSGWTSQALAYASGGTVHYTTTPGSKASFTVTPPQTGPLAGKVHLALWKWDTAAGATSAAVTIDVDGSGATTYTPFSWEQYVGQTGSNVAFVPDCQTVTVPVDGSSHVINVTHAGAGGQYAYVDFVSVPAVMPNPIAMMGNETGPNSGPYWTAPQCAVWLQNQLQLLADAKSVVAEFPNAFYVASNMTSNGVYSGDGIHPNDRGHGQRTSDLVDAGISVLKPRMDSYVLQQMSNASFARL